MPAVPESPHAYPVLFYFRSSHDNEAWLNSFGAVMDAAALVISSLDGPAAGAAKLTLTIGDHLVEDMVWYFNFPRSDDVGVERSEFDEALDRLEKVGYKVHPRDHAWESFSKIRSEDAVAPAARDGASLYEVDTAVIRELRPDLVVAQDVCRVCAVPASQVMDDLSPIPVLRQHPHTFDEVLRDIEGLASACQTDASSLMSSLRERVAAAAEKALARRRVRGVFLEWLDPPYPAGHWTPDILSLAGIDG